jgi:glycine/D-amino acid oxidase-like deaminating enzyme
LPALKDIHHGKVQVGLRPYRDDGIRLEHEKTIDGLDIIHCYGHSGSGITLSWGAAKDVVEIVKTLLSSAPDKKKKHLPEDEHLWRLIENKTNIHLQSKY